MCVLWRGWRTWRLVPTMRVGFVLGEAGFAAVLYRQSTEDARRRGPWRGTPDEAMADGLAWGGRLSVPVDVVRVDVRLLTSDSEGTLDTRGEASG